MPGSGTGHERVRATFARAAPKYRTSRRHADPAPLRAMLALLAPRGDERVLDLATGGGHTAAALAPFVRTVVATDLLPEMLHEAGLLFRGADVEDVHRVAADAQALPFTAASFDLVTVRCAPHHFGDVGASLSEVARVLRPGGRFYVVDVGVPEEPRAAEWVNEVERTRDPSHVRALSRAEWVAALERAGLRCTLVRELPSVYDVPSWLDQLEAPPDRRAAVLSRLAQPPGELPQPLGVDLTPGAERFASVRIEALAERPA